MGAAGDTELLARVLRNPGRLCFAPTNVSAAFPHGGTAIGVVAAVELEWDVRYFESRDPASGAIAEVARRSVEVPRIAMLLEHPWDEDALTALHNKSTAYSSLSVQTPRETRIEGTVIPRSPVAAWEKLLFSASDPNGKSVLFRRPVPLLSLRQSVAFAASRRAGLPVVFVPTPDSAWASTPHWQIARIENLTL